MANDYPTNPAQWRIVIEAGIGLSSLEAVEKLQAGKFPYKRLEEWIKQVFSDGFSPDFVPALLRNLHGLVHWVYGEGSEPYWPGSDEARG